MGRSKFPGKPSKHILKKRVNVIPPTGDTPDSDNVSCGSSGAPQTKGQSNNENICDNGSGNNVMNYELSPRPSKIIDSCKVKKRRKSKKNLISSLRANGFKSKLKTIQKTRKRISKQTDNIKRQLTRSAFESKGIVGKFVLPSRSIHSSRVIKPNKRFINVDINETTSLKRKIISKALCPKNSKVMNVKRLNEKTNKYNNKNFCNSITERISKDHVILRQARLKLHSQNMVKPVGPFSSNINIASQPGTVTCGVCGAVRFYRFIKQARKFNIYSCESCRKFISKMIKRQSCKSSSSTLVCHKGHGMCHVPPIVRSQQCKLTRSAYRARCPACWLKMCLRSFQMPSPLKNSLIQILPENMQDPSSYNNIMLPCQPLVNTVKRKLVDNKPFEHFRQCTVKVTDLKPVSSMPSSPLTDSNINRQKINVKGPRVKHVCRSASIVLGQNVATFPFNKIKPIETQDLSSVETKKKSLPESKKSLPESTKTKGVASSNEVENEKSIKTNIDSNKPNVPSSQDDKKQKNTSPVPVSAPVLKTSLKQNKSRLRNKISIDYWKYYDQSGTTENGYCLIATEQFSITAVCYLCGSAGKETLLYCALCCEPYHVFCLDQTSFIVGVTPKEKPWLCPKCSVCVACDESIDRKVECPKCCRTYHPSCLNNTQAASDITSVVCTECSSCKYCGAPNVTEFIVNTPICMSCFKMKYPGKKCPFCQDYYDRHSSKDEVIECKDCDSWIHLKCANVLEEHLSILRILPNSVGYTCNSCAELNIPYWCAAINFKLNQYFHQILRHLSENRNIRNLLKWNLNNNINNKSLIFIKRSSGENNAQIESDSFDMDCDDSNESRFDHYEMYDELPFGTIRSKIHSYLYKSIEEFNLEMEEVIGCAGSEQLTKLYQSILYKVFPQFSCSRTTEMYQSCSQKESKDLIVMYKDAPLLSMIPFDTRFCVLCQQNGDGSNEQESRLLYCGNNEWVHANCALWSQEVYENINGFLKNLHTALSRGKVTSCVHCKHKGATLNCSYKDCSKVFHFHCAQKANCIFLINNVIFCQNHIAFSCNISICKDFTVTRPIYIGKSKTESYSEIEKVNVMVGSLRINSLGKINSVLSDSNEAIIPIGFKCTRLYWSAIEPWKVISYTISTSTGSSYVSSTINTDTNFTVDHSLPSYIVNQKLKDMNLWFRDIDRKHNFESDEDEEENQNDLLSPELTDAIFEEIPHDLLDRISVQDIFPKFISYDEFVNNNDIKPEDNILSSSVLTKYKLEDNLLSKHRSEKDFKSELVFRNKEKLGETKSHKSCSVTVSCKVNRSVSPTTKKRKVIAARQSNLLVQLVQLDGNFDDEYDSDSKSSDEQKLIPQLDGNADDSLATDFQYFFDATTRQLTSVPEEPVTCNRCHCTYRTTMSYNKHLDSCEVVTSESDSEMIEQDNQIVGINVATIGSSHKMKSPEKLNGTISFIDYSHPQHGLSIENIQKNMNIIIQDKKQAVSNMVKVSEPKPIEFQGTNINLNLNNSIINTPTSVIITQQPNSINTSHNQIYQQPLLTFSTENKPQCTTNQLPIYSNQALPPGVQINMLVNPTTVPHVDAGINLLNTSCVNYQNASISINPNNEATTIQNFQPVSISTQPLSVSSQPVYMNNMNSYVSMEPQPVAINGKIYTNPNIINNQLVNVITPESLTKTNLLTSTEESLSIKNPVNKQNETFILQTSTAPTVQLVQNIPPTNYVSYIAHNYAQDDGKHSMTAQLAPQTVNSVTAQLAPQTVPQIQPENTISIIPGIQPTLMIQPQYVIDNNIPLTFTQQPVPQMYYGFETIIQNTVMASQQILPTAVPGIITANSSYSTTTQVFQTTSSKLEPVLDIPQSALVVVSSGQIIGTIPLQLSYTQAPQLQVSTINQINPQTIKFTDALSNLSTKTVASNVNGISLPTAPLVLKRDQTIPTNVTVANPKTANKNFRPMNRVLPMKKNVVSMKRPIEEVDKPIMKDDSKDVPVISLIEKDKKPVLKRDIKEAEFFHKVKGGIVKPLTAETVHLKPTVVRESAPLKQYVNKASCKPLQKNLDKMIIQVPHVPVKKTDIKREFTLPPNKDIRVEYAREKVINKNDTKTSLPYSVLSNIVTPVVTSKQKVLPVNTPVTVHNRFAMPSITPCMTSTKTVSASPIITSVPLTSVPSTLICQPIISKTGHITSSASHRMNTSMVSSSVRRTTTPVTVNSCIPSVKTPASSSSSFGTDSTFSTPVSLSTVPVTSTTAYSRPTAPVMVTVPSCVSPTTSPAVSSTPHSSVTLNPVVSTPVSTPSSIITPTSSPIPTPVASPTHVSTPTSVQVSVPTTATVSGSVQEFNSVPDPVNCSTLTSVASSSSSADTAATSLVSTSPVLASDPVPTNFSIPTPPISPVAVSTATSEKTVSDASSNSTGNNINGTRKKSTEKAPSLLYTIETQDGYRYSSTNLVDLWSKVVEMVQNARAAHNIPTVPQKPVSAVDGLQLLGLNTDILKYLIEQLPGATKCSKYEPSFGFSTSQTESEDETVFGHMSGAVRCVPYTRNHDIHDMFGWLTSKHRKPEYNSVELDCLPRRNSVSNLPMTMRFRQLKLTSKYSVGVYRSKIHRRGLFCLRDIEAGEMVIEYAGEVIRSVLCDKREKYYNSKGIGCYMFRVDDNLVVDATMKGNAARFINHSCDPNCYSKVVEIFGHKHIIIFALRKILSGEELTYDYKFPFEEDKIPCTCGSRRCRKFLN